LAVALWMGAAGLAVAALAWAWLGGWQLDVIQSGSMAPAMQRNSLAVVIPVVSSNVHRGDVVAFTDRSRDGARVIHRVERVIVQHGNRFFETKGDANAAPDTWLVPGGDVQGRLGWRARHLGAVVRALAPPVGPIVLIGFPLCGLLLTELRGRRSARQFKRVNRGPKALTVR
jgi:signal peptidase